MALRLKGKLILISGGANGIGKASALRFAAEGASLSISDLNKDKGKSLVSELRANYPQQEFDFEEVDVTNPTAVSKHVSRAAAAYATGVSGLLCSAGIAIPGPRMHEVALETYLKVVDVNLHGTYHYNSAVLREMVRQNQDGKQAPKGGYAIVNIGSKASVEGLPGASAYCATKHAVLGFSRVNAKDYALENIRTNILCPGLTLTELMKQLIASGQPELSEAHQTSRVYAGRMAQPEEMAAAAAFLMGPDSSYMTGQALVVDGQWSP